MPPKASTSAPKPPSAHTQAFLSAIKACAAEHSLTEIKHFGIPSTVKKISDHVADDVLRRVKDYMTKTGHHVFPETDYILTRTKPAAAEVAPSSKFVSIGTTPKVDDDTEEDEPGSPEASESESDSDGDHETTEKPKSSSDEEKKDRKKAVISFHANARGFLYCAVNRAVLECGSALKSWNPSGSITMDAILERMLSFAENLDVSIYNLNDHVARANGTDNGHINLRNELVHNLVTLVEYKNPQVADQVAQIISKFLSMTAAALANSAIILGARQIKDLDIINLLQAMCISYAGGYYVGPRPLHAAFAFITKVNGVITPPPKKKAKSDKPKESKSKEDKSSDKSKKNGEADDDKGKKGKKAKDEDEDDSKSKKKDKKSKDDSEETSDKSKDDKSKDDKSGDKKKKHKKSDAEDDEDESTSKDKKKDKPAKKSDAEDEDDTDKKKNGKSDSKGKTDKSSDKSSKKGKKKGKKDEVEDLDHESDDDVVEAAEE